MRIAIASSSLLALPTLEAISGSSNELVAIITTPDSEQGRGRVLTPSDLAQWAADQPIPVYKFNKESISDFLRSHQIDLVITLSFGKIVSQEALDIPPFGWLNVHFSQLPRWRGAAPVQRALLEGDTETGISIFKLDPGMDTGPIYLSKSFPIPERSTTEELLHDLSLLAGNEIVAVIEAIQAGAVPTPQNGDGVTYAEKISPTMGKIDWQSSGVHITRLSRALSGNVGLFTHFRGTKLNFYGARLFSHNLSECTPGSPLLTGEKNQKLVIACSDALIQFDRVKPAGKSEMKSEDFLRGARLTSEERFM